MDRYAVAFSARANRDIAEIERDAPGFGPIQTERYVDELISRCERLDVLPHRGTPILIRGREYRRFRHGGHMIYYLVFEIEKRVSIEAVLRGSRDFRRHL